MVINGIFFFIPLNLNFDLYSPKLNQLKPLPTGTHRKKENGQDWTVGCRQTNKQTQPKTRSAQE